MRFIRRHLAGTTRCLRLEHTPTVVTRMNDMLRLLHDEVDLIAPSRSRGVRHLEAATRCLFRHHLSASVLYSVRSVLRLTSYRAAIHSPPALTSTHGYAKLETAALAHVDDSYYYDAYCRKCKHAARLSLEKLLERLGDSFPLRKVKERLRCERCSSRQIVNTFPGAGQENRLRRGIVFQNTSEMTRTSIGVTHKGSAPTAPAPSGCHSRRPTFRTIRLKLLAARGTIAGKLGH